MGSSLKRYKIIPQLSPSILYHHILNFLRLWKNSASELQTQSHPGYDDFFIICIPVLTYPTYVYNIFGLESGPQIYRYWTRNGGDNQWRCCKKWQQNSFVTDNAREYIIENCSTRPDEPESIKKGNGQKQRTKIVRDYCGMSSILHTTFYYYRYTNIDLLGVCDMPHPFGAMQK